MAAQPHEQVLFSQAEEIEAATQRFREANIRLAHRAGVFGPEMEDVSSPHLQRAGELVDRTGEELARLLDGRPRIEETMPVKGLFKVFGKILKRA